MKRAEKWNREWKTPLRSLEKLQGIERGKRIGVYTGKRSYVFDGVEVLPVEAFLDALYDGKIF